MAKTYSNDVYAIKHDPTQTREATLPATLNTYDVDIAEGRAGFFTYSVRGTPLTGKSKDPEHEACRAIIESGRPDGAVAFWRKELMSMQARSAARMAQWAVDQNLRRYRFRTLPPERLAA
jgi:hypothetical protein